MIAIDKFDAGADENVFILRPQRRKFGVNVLEQLRNARVFGKIDIDGLKADKVAQLRVKLDVHFHFTKSFRNTPMQGRLR